MESQRPNGHRRRALVRRFRRWRRVAGEVQRREGPARLLARGWAAVRATVYRDVVIVALDLSREIPAIEERIAVEIRFLQPDDVAAYARFRALPVDRVAVCRRLDRGDACIAAWFENEIVAAGWYSFESAWVDDVDRGLRLAPGDIFGYDLYVVEHQRGRGVASQRGRWAAVHLRERGYRRIVAGILRQNLPVHGTAQKLGYEVLGRAGFVRLGPWRRDFVLPTGGSRKWARRDEPIDTEKDFG